MWALLGRGRRRSIERLAWLQIDNRLKVAEPIAGYFKTLFTELADQKRRENANQRTADLGAAIDLNAPFDLIQVVMSLEANGGTADQSFQREHRQM